MVFDLMDRDQTIGLSELIAQLLRHGIIRFKQMTPDYSKLAPMEEEMK